MHKCPFHADSQSAAEEGEIRSIKCPSCGNYRISETALGQLANLTKAPRGWRDVVSRRPLISTRDTRMLLA